jgi:hypothetical protein
MKVNNIDPDVLIMQHWAYIQQLLKVHNIKNIEIIKFHYIEAFKHGFKHGLECKCKNSKSTLS